MRARLSVHAVFVAICVIGLVLTTSIPAHSEEADALFKAKCAMCHGADAAGKTAMGAKLNIPDLRSPEVQKLALAEVKTIIAKGKNKMPSYEGKLAADQIAQLATYVHGLKK